MSDRRYAILDAARELISEKGFAGASMREIASRAGVSLGNLYNHFSNKRDIFHALMDPSQIIESLGEMVPLLQHGFPSNLNEVVLGIKKVVDNNISLYRLIFIDLIEFAGENTDRIISKISGFADAVFSENVENRNLVGTVLKSYDYHSAIRVFIVAFVSYFITNNILPSARVDYDEETVSTMIADILLNGVRA